MAQLSEKDTGTIAELAFSSEAMRRGYRLAQPLGDNAQYDLLLEARDRVFRIQVKASSNTHQGVYTFLLRRGKHKVSYTEVDVFACYLIPERLFFILPRNEIKDRRTIKLNATPRTSMWAKYRENWGVFEQQLPGLKNIEKSP